jgi:hypothetical protein
MDGILGNRSAKQEENACRRGAADSYFTGLKCGCGDDCSNPGDIVV